MMQKLNRAKENFEAMPGRVLVTPHPASLALAAVVDLRELRAIVAHKPLHVALAAIDERLAESTATFRLIAADAHRLLGPAAALVRELRRAEHDGGVADAELAEACLSESGKDTPPSPREARDAFKAFFADIFGDPAKGDGDAIVKGLVGSRLIGPLGAFNFVSLPADVDRAAAMISAAAKCCGAGVAAEIAESISVAARAGEASDTVLPILQKHIEGQRKAAEATPAPDEGGAPEAPAPVAPAPDEGGAPEAPAPVAPAPESAPIAPDAPEPESPAETAPLAVAA